MPDEKDRELAAFERNIREAIAHRSRNAVSNKLFTLPPGMSGLSTGARILSN
jgi:hypothetical protein